jgi:hypothetical protein
MESFYKALEERVKESPESIFRKKLIDKPYETIVEMVGWGKKLKAEDIKNELVYSLLNLNYDDNIEEDLGDKVGGPYMSNMVRLNGRTLHSKYIFTEFFDKNITKLLLDGTEKNISPEKYLHGAGKNLVESVFGKDTYTVFRYAYTKHLQTKKMRAGTNTYFTHPVRVANDLRIQGFSRPYILVALLHDVIEEMQDFRYKKIDKIIKILRKNPKRYKEYESPTTIINQQIKDPPEFKEIVNLARKGEDISETVIKPVRAISNNLGKDKYDQYIVNLFKVSIDYLSNPDENIQQLYDLAPMVKIRDAIDNTETLIGTSINQKLNRLRKNAILSEKTYRFLSAHNIGEEENKKIWNNLKELVELSLESSNQFHSRYYKEAKKYKKGEKKEELFDRSYIHIADQFSQIHDRLIKVTKEIFPNTTKYIESRNLQTILNIFKSKK